MKQQHAQLRSPKIGERVHVEGTHKNYRPFLMRIEEGVGFVRSLPSDLKTEYSYPMTSLSPHSEWIEIPSRKRPA